MNRNPMKKYSASYDLINGSKNNQTWKGKNKFLLKRNLYIGPQYYFGLMILLYLLLYAFCFVFYVIRVN